eukprot:s3528_g1.t1
MSSTQRPRRSVSACQCPCPYRFQVMCCLALISTGAITASWSQIQQFTWQGSALLDSARIPLPDTEEGGKDIDPDFPPDILDEEAATDFGNGSAEEQAAVRSSSRSSSEEVPDGPDGDPRSQSEEDQEHAGVFNLDEVEDESHGTTLAKKVRHDDGKAPTTLLGIYQELCHMGLRSPGAIRLAAPELRDAVVRLYQPLVERQPPAAFHPERMVTPKSPNCKDPAWKHILDGTRRAVPRALVDVTTGMGGGPELDLLELRLWEINASLGDQPKPAIKSLRAFSTKSNLRVPDMEDWLLMNDNATSFLYKHEERRLGYQPSDPPVPSASRTARHVLTMCDLSRDEVMDILRVAAAMKQSRRTYLDTGFDRFSETLKGYSLLTLFEKPSLRTRVSLEVGMNQLGGQAIFYSIADSPLGVKESIQDTGKVLSRIQGLSVQGSLHGSSHAESPLQRVILVVTSLQGLVALCRFAVGDVWGGLCDILVPMIGLVAVFERKAIYSLLCAFANFVDLCLSMGLCLGKLLRSMEGQKLSLDLQSGVLLTSASLALLGFCASILMWRDLRAREAGCISGAEAAVMYGSLKDGNGGQSLNDPFLLDPGLASDIACQGITARVMTRKALRSLAQVAEVPVVNALDDYAHPLQMLADLLTVLEYKGSFKDFTMTYMGDLENNVTYDLMRTAALMGYNLNLAGQGDIEKSVWEEVNTLAKASGSKVKVCASAAEAMTGVDCVYTDSWMSYGIPKEEEEARMKLFMPYQVTTDLMKLAKPDCIFMNCLPAARGMEQTAEVMDGPQSVVFDQAENRLHAMKALAVFLMAPKRFAEIMGLGRPPAQSKAQTTFDVIFVVDVSCLDVYVISESAYGLRGDQKPLHFSRQRERFKPFLPQVEHILLDNCTKYSSAISKMRRETNKGKKKGGTMFSAESIQRICVLKTLIQRRPEIPDDALLIFSDLDEVPSAQAIQMLRLCKTKSSAKDGPWIQAHYPLPYNLRVGCKARKKTELHYQGVFTTMGFLRRKKGLALRYNMKRNLIVPRAGIHLTYVGSRADVDYKLLHHGESGQSRANAYTTASCYGPNRSAPFVPLVALWHRQRVDMGSMEEMAPIDSNSSEGPSGGIAPPPVTQRELRQLGLTKLSDAEAFAQLIFHTGCLAVCAMVVMWAYERGHWGLLLLSYIPFGVVESFLFNGFHECVHNTAFETKMLNTAFAHLLGFENFRGAKWFWCFHWSHHRFTNDPDKDPELSGESVDLDDPTKSLKGYLQFVSGYPFGFERVLRMARTALYNEVDPWVAEKPAATQQFVRMESAAYLCGYVTLAVAGLLWWRTVGVKLVLLWIVPHCVGAGHLRLYQFAEHRACKMGRYTDTNAWICARTTSTWWLYRKLAWYMPFHVEHHAFPNVLATKATATGKRLNFCEIDEKTLASMEQLLRDNPVSVARAWERGKSSVLRKEPAGELSKCQVPWALLTHPERYPHFWGRAAK